MHKSTNSAEPYLYQVTIDCTLPITKCDSERFLKVVNLGIAVYGYTPNILVIAESDYTYWPTIKNLVSAMITGKLAICTDEKLDNIHNQLCSDFPTIEVCLFNTAEMDKCKQWVTT